jgi:hypothetical protein
MKKKIYAGDEVLSPSKMNTLNVGENTDMG